VDHAHDRRRHLEFPGIVILVVQIAVIRPDRIEATVQKGQARRLAESLLPPELRQFGVERIGCADIHALRLREALAIRAGGDEEVRQRCGLKPGVARAVPADGDVAGPWVERDGGKEHALELRVQRKAAWRNPRSAPVVAVCREQGQFRSAPSAARIVRHVHVRGVQSPASRPVARVPRKRGAQRHRRLLRRGLQLAVCRAGIDNCRCGEIVRPQSIDVDGGNDVCGRTIAGVRKRLPRNGHGAVRCHRDVTRSTLGRPGDGFQVKRANVPAATHRRACRKHLRTGEILKRDPDFVARRAERELRAADAASPTGAAGRNQVSHIGLAEGEPAVRAPRDDDVVSLCSLIRQKQVPEVVEQHIGVLCCAQQRRAVRGAKPTW